MAFPFLICIVLKGTNLFFTSPLRRKKKRYVEKIKKTCLKQHLKATALPLTH